MQPHTEKWLSHLLNVFALLVAALMLDIVLSGRDLSQANHLCEVVTSRSVSALALALSMLTLSHKLSMQPRQGTVPITGQTCVLCINALCFPPAIAVGALCLYVALGVSSRAGLAPLGPQVNEKSSGYLAGFFPATLLLGTVRRVFGWPLTLMPAMGGSVLAQGVVLAAGWLRRHNRAPASVTVCPYLPGLLLKAAVAALAVDIIGSVPAEVMCRPVSFP